MASNRASHKQGERDMTRKDYELIARVLNRFQHDGGHVEICETMADDLATTNPLFNRARFLTACGVN
jgi:hypothetical protein